MASIVLIGGGIGVASALTGADAAPPTLLTPSAAAGPSEATPSPSASAAATDPLTGLQASDHEVVAVKVENIGLARPQVGLHAADIVFAEEVEGAQTRLVAIYHSTFPKAVEPVRSARSTDVQLLLLFGRPGLVYSGANARVQAKIDDSPIVPISRQTRDPHRSAPHNVRVDLDKIVATKEMGRAESIGWTFAQDDDQLDPAPPSSVATTKVGHDTFTFSYVNGRYTVRWNGKTYADGEDGTLTKADNVVIMNVHNHPDGNRDVLGSASVQSDTVGQGKVSSYRDGTVWTGTWSRDRRSGPLHFQDAAGRDIALHPGQTWIALHG